VSENINVIESPKHFIVLDAISRGIEDAGKIARVTKNDKAEVGMILNDLEFQRLVIIQQKKSFFGSKKKLYARITGTGRRLLSSKKQELEEKASEFRDMYRNGDRRGMQSFMDDNRIWLPMMIFSGIMSAMMFPSMMSFMGMAMNPAESAVAGDTAANTGEDAQGTSTGDDTQSVAADETGGADTGGGTDSGGTDFSGFDAGSDVSAGDFGGGAFEF
jgi:DNA-binding MarR family transcriptional regulator